MTRKKTMPPLERDMLWGCLLWRGATDADGYGDPGRGPRAHVIAFRASGRRERPGQVVDHVCRRRACVEPRHLQAVTRAVNEYRKRAGYRQRIELCPYGHRIVTPAFTPEGGRLCRVCLVAIQTEARRSATAGTPRTWP